MWTMCHSAAERGVGGPPCQHKEEEQEAGLVQQIEPLALPLQIVEFQDLHDAPGHGYAGPLSTSAHA